MCVCEYWVYFAWFWTNLLGFRWFSWCWFAGQCDLNWWCCFCIVEWFIYSLSSEFQYCLLSFWYQINKLSEVQNLPSDWWIPLLKCVCTVMLCNMILSGKWTLSFLNMLGFRNFYNRCGYSSDLFVIIIIIIFRLWQIDENVQREIINHRSLRHPNIVRFKEVILTPTHLAIVMEYASGGELFERICNAGRFSEDEVHIQINVLFGTAARVYT